MKARFQIFLLLLVLLSGCKANQEAYNAAYRKLKEKEESLMDTKARAAMNVPEHAISKDSSFNYSSESFNLILGEDKNLSDFNIVARSFINRTNARGYYSQMLDDGYPAVLVQNEENMFRIIIGSSALKEEAEKKLTEIRKTHPEATIFFRIK